jgi:hypothetical protein
MTPKHLWGGTPLERNYVGCNHKNMVEQISSNVVWCSVGRSWGLIGKVLEFNLIIWKNKTIIY